MLAAKTTYVVIATLALLYLLLLSWIIFGDAGVFYILGVIDLTSILCIFTWIAVDSIVMSRSDNRSRAASRTAAFISVAAVVILVTFLSIRRPKVRKTYDAVSKIVATILFAAACWALGPSALKLLHKAVASVRGAGHERELRVEYNFLRKIAGLPIEFRHEELAAATDGFQTLVGRGASGFVYHGILEDGTPVAVKSIEGEARSRRREFMAEVAAIASVQHANLVRLLGYCLASETRRLLVYEFIPNGSLDTWIFRPDRCLTWAQRYQVAVDVARALSYIHHDCRRRLLHLDIKPENILLDEGFRAYVSDFGLSRFLGRGDDSGSLYTSLRGTRGYFAPEWFISEKGVTEKSDVYSYGMVVLEMVGGRRNLPAPVNEDGGNSAPPFAGSYFPRVASERARDGRVMELVEERVAKEAVEVEVKTLMYVALWCIQEKVEMRPSMARVVGMLEGDVAVEEPPPTPMFMVDFLSSGRSAGLVDLSGSGGGSKGHLPPSVTISVVQSMGPSSSHTASSIP